MDSIKYYRENLETKIPIIPIIVLIVGKINIIL